MLFTKSVYTVYSPAFDAELAAELETNFVEQKYQRWKSKPTDLNPELKRIFGMNKAKQKQLRNKWNKI